MQEMKGYQINYSEVYSHEVDDPSRILKALKTLSILQDCARDLSKLDALEVGCFAGQISLVLAPHFKSWHAIDIDPNAVQLAEKRNAEGPCNTLRFSVMNAELLEFADESFDVVICSHIYEHVPHPHRMMDQIYRVLKKGGICYFAAANRLVVMEPHYRLPFLTYLPKSLANLYLQCFKGRSPYYETHLGLSSLRKLAGRFEVTDYTKKVIQDPVKFHASDVIEAGSLKQRVILLLLNLTYWFCPTYIWILRKPE